MTLRFCKVNDDLLEKQNRPYAVLSLVTDCPVAATTVDPKQTMRIDTEDDNNRNAWSSGLAPNVINSFGASLQFCVFGTTSSPAPMPNLGMPYAVFHDFDVTPGPWVLEKKYFFFNDENDTPTTR